MERRRFAGRIVVAGLVLGGVLVAWAGQTKLGSRPEPGSRDSTPGTQPQIKEILQLQGRGPEQPLPAGTTHAYLFDLEAGDFLDIVLEQKDLDVVAKVLSPERRFLFQVDSLNGSSGPEHIPLFEERAGRYTVETTGRGSGTYQIRVEPRRKATARDRQNHLGAMAYSRGKELAAGKRWLLAEAKFQEALSAWTKSGYLAGQADASFKLVMLRGNRSAWGELPTLGRRALELYQKLGNRRQEAHSFNNLGLIFWKVKGSDKAEYFFDGALDLAHALKDVNIEAEVLFNRGMMHSETGEYPIALSELKRALEIRREQNKHHAVVNVLNAMGRLYSNLEDFNAALRLHGQALKILQRYPDSNIKAATLTHVGDTYRGRNDPTQAIHFYSQALAITRRSGLQDDPSTLNNLALAHLHSQQYAEALNALRHCEKIFASQGNTGLAAVAWSNIGWVLTSMERYKAAFDAYKRSLAMVRDPPAEAATYLGMAWAERKQGNLITAHHFLNRGLALVESLHTRAARAKLRTLYLAGRQDFYDLLVEILMELHRREPARGYDLQAFEASERARSRSLLDVLEGQPVSPALSVRDLQRQALGQDVVLLEYFLGMERSFLWIVTDSSFRSRELPAGDRISRLAQEVHNLMSASNRIENRREAVEKATELSRILFGGVAGRLKGKRVLIVAPPALQYISFNALPLDVASIRRSGGAWPAPWAMGHEIVIEPSATVLVTLRRKRGERAFLPSDSIATLADPIYSRADERVQRPSPPALRRGGSDLLSRLLFSQGEVNAIRRQAKGGKRLFALGFDASRQLVLGGGLSDYRYLHFSTHGFLDKHHPDRSAIVLSLLDRKGNEVNGHLRAGEIASLKLPAELVVLSACKTGLGHEVRGEGLVGLTQAFFSAGASRVVVSLWDVDAQATAELVSRFYRNLFHEDLTPAAALREAQEWMWRQQKWNAPAYWAGFVLQGEWQ